MVLGAVGAEKGSLLAPPLKRFARATILGPARALGAARTELLSEVDPEAVGDARVVTDFFNACDRLADVTGPSAMGRCANQSLICYQASM